MKSSISLECNTSTRALISFLSLSPLRTATMFAYGESKKLKTSLIKNIKGRLFL
jgi:hypothetical protein